ncbi:MAG: CPBP family intramembrane glutamic endopeptidase [Nitrospiria bacterium]
MKSIDLLSLSLLFIGCFGSVYFLPEQSFNFGKNFISFALILGGYGIFLLSIYLSFLKIESDRTIFRAKGILFGVTGVLYILYGFMATIPVLKLFGALLLFFVLVYYGQVLSDGLVILIGFAAIKSSYFSAPLVRYDIVQTPITSIDLFYFALAAIIIFQFFVLSKHLKTNLDFSVEGKDLIWVTSLALLLMVLIIPVGMSFGWVQFKPNSLGINQWIPLLFYSFGIVAPLEEIFFRGIIMDRLKFILFDKNPYWIPLCVSAIVFGLAHLPSIPMALLASIAGCFYGAGYLLTKRISTPILIHGLVNILWITTYFVLL